MPKSEKTALPYSALTIKKTAFAAVFIALAVALSPFTSFPIGIAKVNPTQHFINVLFAAMMGPLWAVGGAGAISLIRNILGTGTLMAFPGSMIGALLSGLTFRFTKNLTLTALAEVIGTGVFGSLLSALWIAPSFLHKNLDLWLLGASFAASSLAGSVLALLVLKVLKKARVIPDLGPRSLGAQG